MRRIVSVLMMLVLVTIAGAQDKDKKKTKEERKAERREMLIKTNEKNLKLAKDSTFVLETYSASDRYGNTVQLNPRINFIAVHGRKVTVQLVQDNRIGGPNGMGGITLDGHIVKYQITEKKKASAGFTINLTASGVVMRFLDIQLDISPGTRSRATIRSNFGSNRIVYEGRYVSLVKSDVFKGFAY